MVWRGCGGRDNTSKRDALAHMVTAGAPVSLVADEEGEPVAWCSIAPRESCCKFGGPEPGSVAVWAVDCVLAMRGLWGRDITARLPSAAMDLAGERGADIAECRPLDSDSPSHRFVGVRSASAGAGIGEVERGGSRHHIARSQLS